MPPHVAAHLHPWVEHRVLNDLRDTFASQLLTLGLARICLRATRPRGRGGEGAALRTLGRRRRYRERMGLEPGEVLADLFARFTESPRESPHLASGKQQSPGTVGGSDRYPGVGDP